MGALSNHEINESFNSSAATFISNCAHFDQIEVFREVDDETDLTTRKCIEEALLENYLKTQILIIW